MSALSSVPRSRRPQRRGAAAVVAALALFGPLAAAPAAIAAGPTPSITVTVDAAATEGDTVTATVTATGLTDVYAYDLTFALADDLAEVDAASVTGPDGGFTSAVVDAPGAWVSHTRLGTSPGLTTTDTTPLTLAVVPITTLGAGTADIDLVSVRLVSSTGEVATLNDVASDAVVIAPAPTPTPTATPTPTVTPSTTPSASPTATAVPAANDSSSGDLATTGADAAPWLVTGAVAVVLIAAGALFVARRRQAVHQ